MLLERDLGLSESYSCFCHDEAGGTTNLVGYACVTGDIDRTKITNSLKLMMNKHHSLRSKFIKNDKKHKIEILEFAYEIPVTFQENENLNWQDTIEKQQQLLFNEGDLNWRLEVIKSNEKHHIFVCFHHAISDGKSTSIFLSELLSGCEPEYETKNINNDQRPLLPAIESLLQRKISWLGFLFKMLTSSSKYLILNKHIQKYEVKQSIEGRSAKNKHLIINKEKMEQLLQQCRNENTTFTALLTATLLKSIEKLELGSSAEIKKHLLFTNIDVRDKCIPKIPDDQIGCYVDLAETQEIIKPSDSIWDIAKNYRSNLMRALNKPGKLPYTFNQPLFHKMLRSFDQGFLQHRFQYGAGVTNIGKVDHFNELNKIKIERFHFATSRAWGDWMVLLHVATLNDQAYLSFSYADPLLSNDSAEKLILSFTNILDGLLHKTAA